MTGFKRYFILHLKTSLRAIITILVAVLAVTFLLGISNRDATYFVSLEAGYAHYFESRLYIPVFIMCILAYVLPVKEFSFFKKRINLDFAYSLPISRRVMGVVHYLSGLIILFGAFTLSYLLNFFLLLGYRAGSFDFLPMIAHYFLCLLLGFAMYSVMTFVFNEANTKGDGIWFMVLYTFVLSLVFSAIGVLSNSNIGNLIGAATSWGTVSALTGEYQNLVEVLRHGSGNFWGTFEYVISFVYWIVLGIAAALGLFFTFGKRRMERTEEISDSFFGYRTLIPIYAVSGMISFGTSEASIFWVIIELIAFLGYTIYRRGFHYKKSDIIILSLLSVFLFV